MKQSLKNTVMKKPNCIMICKLMSKQSKTKELKKMDQEEETIIEEMTRIEKEIIMKPQKRMPRI